MIVCIDYDGTYNLYPELLDFIIEKSHQLGYKVILATMRNYNEIDEGLKSIGMKLGEENVFYTNRKAKGKYLEDLGLIPDIWIDDEPKWIVRDAI